MLQIYYMYLQHFKFNIKAKTWLKADWKWLCITINIFKFVLKWKIKRNFGLNHYVFQWSSKICFLPDFGNEGVHKEIISMEQFACTYVQPFIPYVCTLGVRYNCTKILFILRIRQNRHRAASAATAKAPKSDFGFNTFLHYFSGG